MTVQILIDLNHNENFTRVPDGIFDLEYIFTYVNRADPFPLFRELTKYDVLIIGDIIPSKNRKDHLFSLDEIRNIKKYVRNGGNLFLTASSGGDFEYQREIGSIRAFGSITGVDRFWWGEIFSKTKESYIDHQENVIYDEFSDHEIFKGLRKIILADSTFLEPKDHEDVEEIFFSHNDAWFRYFEDDFEEKIGSVPLIITKYSGRGKSIVIGSTLFMLDDKRYGTGIEDNGKLFKNIIEWLIN